MILCSNCGSQVPEVLASCQFCGTPVPGVTNAANRPGSYAPKQPELPAWLETLRSSERPPTPASSESSYSLPGSVDENALPSWMRSDKMDNSAKMPAMRPASRPAPNTEGGLGSSAAMPGMSAGSLIDEQSLPTWMQEPPAQSPMGQESIPAASLVQSEALPHWMKSVPPQVSQAQPMMPSLSQQAPYTYSPPAVPQQRLSGNDLIDQQALPSWMTLQTPGAAAQGNGPGNVSGGSLIDPNALPVWLREGVQQEQRGVNMPPPGVPGAPAIPVPEPQPVQSPAMNNNIAASSFIDMDALPGWLRATEEQRGASGMNNKTTMGDQNRPGSFGAPARGENMRVPSRPRAEMPSLEESAVAANVFASMLGVASANVPGQPQNGQFPPSAYPAQRSTSPASGTSGSNWSGFPEGTMSAQMPPLAPPPGYGIPTSPGVSNGQQSQGSGMQGSPQQSAAGSFQGNQANQRNQAMPQQVSGNNYQGKQPTVDQTKQSGKKRGFLETILNWFPFSR